MTNAWFLKRKVIQQCPKTCFGITAPVASAVKAAFQNVFEATEILAKTLKVSFVAHHRRDTKWWATKRCCSPYPAKPPLTATKPEPKPKKPGGTGSALSAELEQNVGRINETLSAISMRRMTLRLCALRASPAYPH